MEVVPHLIGETIGETTMYLAYSVYLVRNVLGAESCSVK